MIFLQDPDVTLYHGDVLSVLREFPAESVDCVVTSPPYWGLRDYGTGQWEGGDAECDHLGAPFRTKSKLNENWGAGFSDVKNAEGREPMRDVCTKCGATRIDPQLGLERTPEQYVERMVEVFREVRRVLAAHGTVWLNLGDSYFGTGRGPSDLAEDRGFHTKVTREGFPLSNTYTHSVLKSKDLCGIPWRVAFALQADGWYLRSDIIWAKPNPMPESVTDRPTKAHEYVFLLSKQPRYFFDQEAVREPWAPAGPTNPRARYGGIMPSERRGEEKGQPKASGEGTYTLGNRRELYAAALEHIAYTDEIAFGKTAAEIAAETLDGSDGEAPRGPDGRRKTTVQGADGSIQHRDGERWPNGGRNIRSVWEIATQPYPEAHFATFPEELARRCIAAGCPENGVVLDPFVGSGTVPYVARKLGRHAVGIDLSEEYLQLAAKRLQQQSLFAEMA